MHDLVLEKMILFLQINNPSPDQVDLPDVVADQATARNILAIVFGLAAVLSILIILIASFNIVTGGGDPEKIARGKRAVIYAIVGLIISLSAEVIVFTVLGRLG